MAEKKINRRQFCKAALGFGAVAMNMPPAGPTLGEAKASGPAGKDRAGGLRLPTEVAMVSSPTPREGMALAVDMIDGMDFVTPGSTVLVKPSVNSKQPFPFTTSPAAVEWTVESLYQHGAGHVIVADQSNFITSTEQNMKSNGIYDAAVGAGAEVVFLEDREWPLFQDDRAETWRGRFHFSEIIGEVDHIVSLPRISTHSMSAFTIALKIWVGALKPADRMKMHALHALNLQKCLAELSLAMTTDLVIVDAEFINTRRGPDSGEAVPVGVYMASRDPVASDVASVALLKSIILAEGSGDCEGRDPILCDPAKSIWGFWQIWRAVELGIGIGGPEDITLLTNSPEPDGLDPELEAAIRSEIENVEPPDLPWSCFIGTALEDE